MLEQQKSQVMGTVPVQAAQVHGGVAIQGKQASLIANVSITANSRTAKVKLKRGGDVLVCSTSQFHLMQVGNGASLLFGLDRGAIELHTRTEPQDVILTPDIRFQVKGKGVYDLRLRVTSNGDTCVQNAGNKAPVLMLTDAFSSASYRMMPGQHVLFEDGNLRAVVDSEGSPCGCPSKQKSERLGSGASPAERASAEHPFPVAQSEGLAPTTPAPNSPPGLTETQVATTLSYTPGEPPPPNAMQTPAEIIADGQTPLAPRGLPKPKHSFGYKLKRFFYRMFHPWSGQETSS